MDGCLVREQPLWLRESNMVNLIGYLVGTIFCIVLVGIVLALIFCGVCVVLYFKGKITGKDNAITKWWGKF